jgi:DNA-binding NtrC family response regulator
MSTRVLIVEPDEAILSSLLHTIEPYANAESCPHFLGARDRLVSNQYDRLVTNLKLEAHNGLHLVYLVRASAWPTRSIVYTTHPELYFAHEVQAAGAFYESLDRLTHTVRGYVEKNLPSFDRRHPLRPSRRMSFRGGRRAADLSSSSQLSV